MDLNSTVTITMELRDAVRVSAELRAAYDRQRVDFEKIPLDHPARPGARLALNDLAICLEAVDTVVNEHTPSP